jgi:hypothetical protein
VYLLHEKSKAFTLYKTFEARLLTQKGVKIKVFRTDRGGEYLSKEFNAHLDEQGTTQKLTVHDTLEYNGVSECLNCTLLKKVRVMIHNSGLPKFLWGEAVMHTVWLKNCTWTRALGYTTPHKLMTGKKPEIWNVPAWGCHICVHDMSGSKLDGRLKIGHWVGFDEESNAHRIYWAEKCSVTVERSVKFNFKDKDIPTVLLKGDWEDIQVEQSLSNPYKATVKEIPDHKAPTTPRLDVEPKEGCPKHVCFESDYLKRLRTGEGVTSARPSSPAIPQGIQEGTKVADMAEEWEMVSVEDFAMAAVTEGAKGLMPEYAEAKRRPDWPRWQEAIKEEMHTLEANGTWELVKCPPPSSSVVDCKWVLHIKKNMAGEIEKYKA